MQESVGTGRMESVATLPCGGIIRIRFQGTLSPARPTRITPRPPARTPNVLASSYWNYGIIARSGIPLNLPEYP
jgi:hypothetical protein